MTLEMIQADLVGALARAKQSYATLNEEASEANIKVQAAIELIADIESMIAIGEHALWLKDRINR